MSHKESKLQSMKRTGAVKKKNQLLRTDQKDYAAVKVNLCCVARFCAICTI